MSFESELRELIEKYNVRIYKTMQSETSEKMSDYVEFVFTSGEEIGFVSVLDETYENEEVGKIKVFS